MKFFAGMKEGMSEFGLNIATIINCVLLSIVYIIGVGITSLVAKMTGKHFLKKVTSRKAKTYWEDLNLTKEDMDHYYRQF